MGLLRRLLGLGRKRSRRTKRLPMEQGYARIEGEEVLRHEARGDMLRIIQASPGMSLQEIGSKVRLARGPTQWHLDKLERNGYVARVRHGGESLFFPRNTPPQQAKALAALRHASRRQLLALAAGNPGLRPSEASRLMALGPPTIRHHARALLDLGLLSQVGEGNAVKYLPTALGLQLLRAVEAEAKGQAPAA
jgi:predicted transcriptional regulator